MTRMTGPDCVVMCNLINTHTLPAFFMRLDLVCFYCLCLFVYVLYFIATMSFAGYFLVRTFLSAFHAYLRFPVCFGLVPSIL